MCDEACALSYLLSDVLSAAEAAAQVDVEAERLAEDGIVGLLVELRRTVHQHMKDTHSHRHTQGQRTSSFSTTLSSQRKTPTRRP